MDERGDPDRSKRRWISSCSWVEWHDSFLPLAEATPLLSRLQRQLTWEQRKVVLFGRAVEQPRLICWFGETAYRYSGLTLTPRVPPAWLLNLTREVESASGTLFNHVLLNRYRNGADAMGFHADNERELGTQPVVATLSLGATRRFVLKRRSSAGRTVHELAAGDLMIMGGRCQEEFTHAIPRTRRESAERISLTFRNVLAERPVS
jgi:alkylated DNA repair dioxygenase AlkB